MSETDLAFYGAILQVAGTMFAVLGGLLAGTMMDASRKASAVRMRLQARAFELVMAQRKLGIDGLVICEHYATRILPQMDSLSDVTEVEIRIPSTIQPADVFEAPEQSWVSVRITREDEAAVRQWAACMLRCAELYRGQAAERALSTSAALWDLHHGLDELGVTVFGAGRSTKPGSPWRKVLAQLHASLDDQMDRIVDFDALLREAREAIGIRLAAAVLLFMAALAGAGIVVPLWRLVGSRDAATLALALSTATVAFLGFMAASAVASRRRLLILGEEAIARPKLASPGEPDN